MFTDDDVAPRARLIENGMEDPTTAKIRPVDPDRIAVVALDDRERRYPRSPATPGRSPVGRSATSKTPSHDLAARLRAVLDKLKAHEEAMEPAPYKGLPKPLDSRAHFPAAFLKEHGEAIYAALLND